MPIRKTNPLIREFSTFSAFSFSIWLGMAFFKYCLFKGIGYICNNLVYLAGKLWNSADGPYGSYCKCVGFLGLSIPLGITCQPLEWVDLTPANLGAFLTNVNSPPLPVQPEFSNELAHSISEYQREFNSDYRREYFKNLLGSLGQDYQTTRVPLPAQSEICAELAKDTDPRFAPHVLAAWGGGIELPPAIVGYSDPNLWSSLELDYQGTRAPLPWPETCAELVKDTDPAFPYHEGS